VQEVRRLAQQAYKRRTNVQDPVHKIHKAKRSIYGTMIECAKRVHLEGFLASLDDKLVWTAHRYMSGKPADDGRTHMPTLRVKQVDGSI